MSEKIKLSKVSSYEELLKYIEESVSISKPEAIRNVYRFYKDDVETDVRIRAMVVKLRKEVEIPLKMNKSGSSNFEFVPNKSGNRSSRKSSEKSWETRTAGRVDEERKLRMKNMFWLDPYSKKDQEVYGLYLKAKELLEGKAKKAFTKSIKYRDGLTLTKEHIKVANAVAKETANK